MLIVMTNDANRESVRIRRIILDLHGIIVDSKRVVLFKNEQPLLSSVASYPTARFSAITQKKISHIINRYCNDLDIKLVFPSFKIGNMFVVGDSILGGLPSGAVYRFACAGFNACSSAKQFHSLRHFVVAISIFLLIINYTSNAL